MKFSRICAVMALLPIFAFAQGSVSGNVSADVNSTNTAGASNQGVNTTFNSYGTPFQGVLSQANSSFKTNQAYSVAPSFATGAVWRCATSGWGVAAQAVGGGISVAGKGGESVICVLGYKASLVEIVERMQPTGVQYIVTKALICKDDDIADAYEDTIAKCKPPANVTERRKARYAQTQQPVLASQGSEQVSSLNLLP